jgi:hypothetical protein
VKGVFDNPCRWFKEVINWIILFLIDTLIFQGKWSEHIIDNFVYFLNDCICLWVVIYDWSGFKTIIATHVSEHIFEVFYINIIKYRKLMTKIKIQLGSMRKILVRSECILLWLQQFQYCMWLVAGPIIVTTSRWVFFMDSRYYGKWTHQIHKHHEPRIQCQILLMWVTTSSKA